MQLLIPTNTTKEIWTPTLMVLPIGHWQVGGWNTWMLGTCLDSLGFSCVFFLTFFITCTLYNTLYIYHIYHIYMYHLYTVYIYMMCSAAQGRYFFKGFKYLGEPLEIENQCHFNMYIYIHIYVHKPTTIAC